MSSIETIKIPFKLTPDEVAVQAKSIQKSLTDIDHASEKARAGLDKYVSKQVEANKKVASSTKETKKQYNGLNNSINQITRELPAFTYNAQTGFMAISNNIPMLADSIATLRKQNAELVASGQKATPVWKQLGGALFSWNTLLSVGITLLTVYGKEIGNWLTKMIKGKATLDTVKQGIDAVNNGLKSTEFSKASQGVTQLLADFKLAKKGILSKELVLKKYNKTLGKTIGTTNSFAVAEQKLISQGDAYIQMTAYKAIAIASLSSVQATMLEREKERIKLQNDVDTKQQILVKNAVGASKRGLREMTSALTTAQNKLAKFDKETKEQTKEGSSIYERYMEKASNLAKKTKLNLFTDTDKKAPAKILNEYRKLQQSLKDLDKQYSNQTFDKDKQELNALKAKFDKVRKLVQAFNNNPKNKIKIDLTGLNDLEQKATATLKYRQETKALKNEVEKQEKLYQEFEKAKTTFGKEEAEKRYQNELKNADSLFDEQLADLQDYQTERKNKIEKFNTLYQELLQKGHNKEAEVLKERHTEELNDLDDAKAKKLKSYKALFSGIKNLTKKETKILLAQAKQLLATQKMSASLKEKILAQIKELELQLNAISLDKIGIIVSGIGELGATLEELGNSVGNSGLADIGGLLSGLASNVDNVLVAFDKSATTTDKIQAGVSSLISLVNVFTSAAAERKRVAEDYYLSVMGYQHDYNLSLTEQIRLQSKLNENVFVKDYVGRVKDGLKSLHKANSEYNKALSKLLKEGKVKNGLRNKISWKNTGKATATGAGTGAAIGSMILPGVGTAIGAGIGAVVGFIGGLFGGKKKVPKYVSILKEYPELVRESANGQKEFNRELAESLIKNKLVNKETEQTLKNIIAQEDAMKKAKEQIKGVIKELSGRIGSDLRNELVKAFKEGEDAALKMGDTVSKVLEDMLSQLIFNQVFQKAFDDLEKDMTDSMGEGGDGTWVDDFGRFLETSKGLTDSYNEAMRQAQEEAKKNGIDIFSKNKSKTKGGANSLRGAYKTASQESINLLAGQTGGFRLTQGQTNKILQGGFVQQLRAISKQVETLLKIERNTRKTAENSEELKPIRKGIDKLSKNVKSTENTAKANGF